MSAFRWCPLLPPNGGRQPPVNADRYAVSGAVIAFAGGALQLATGATAGVVLYLPLGLSMVLFGLPHGAIDHLVALGLAQRPLRPLPLLAVSGGYLLLAACFGLLWLLHPAIAALAFLAMTVYHWGKSDTAFELCCRHAPTLRCKPGLRRCHTAVRGAIPIGGPIVFFPAETQAFLETCTGLFGGAPPGAAPLQIIAGLTLAALIPVEGVRLLFERGPETKRLIGETGALLLFFALVPPLAAIGWYFAFWHGLRHILRLMHYRPPEGEPQRVKHPWHRFARQALPFTLLPLLALFGATALLPSAIGPATLVAAYLVLISALTFPHVILVEWMDRVEEPP